MAVLLIPSSCVRRTLTVETEPQGALIWLNDEEIGRSPVSTDFLWYGDYDIIARMEGFRTLVTHQQVQAPWYQTPGLDFFSEILYPGQIHDHRTITLTLEEEIVPDKSALMQDAQAFRERALVE